jgi:hypothetical protein
VKLSSASSLIAAAKTSTSAAHEAKLSSLASLVRSGQYNADSAQVSHAVVEGHLGG